MAWGQAAVDQYIPSVKPGDTGSGGASNPAAGSQQPAASASKQGSKQDSDAEKDSDAAAPVVAEGSSSGGDIPGTGYPLTTFETVVAGLVLAGLLAALVIPRLRRRTGDTL